MVEKNLLVMCSVCQKIRIDDDKNLWLDKEDNPVLYDEFMNRFGGRISDGYCPEDYDEVMEEVRDRRIMQSSQ